MATVATRHPFQSSSGATALSGAGASGTISAAQQIIANSQKLPTVLPNASSRQLCTYLVTLVLNNTNTTASIVNVLDGATVIWSGAVPSNAVTQPNDIFFDPPLKGSPNTAMTIQQVSGSALIWSATGFLGGTNL
jgi:hypothetical protein